MVTIRDTDFRVVATSRNLRGLLTYARKSPVTRVDLYENRPGATWGAQFGVTFADGASSISDFAQFSILVNWVETRKKLSKRWRGATVVTHSQGAQA